MAMVVLLLLSISTLLRVEEQNATQQKSIAEARQYAYLALNIAIGDLQKSLGPDQRISATAGISDTDPYSDVPDGIRADRNSWTGVWEVTENSVNQDAVSGFGKWLVSGFDRAHGYSMDDVADSAGDFVNETLIVSGANSVEVGLVDVSGESSSAGRIGYWVGDEGVKAKVNIPKANLGIDSQRFANSLPISAVDGLEWFDTRYPDSTRASLMGLNSLALISADQPSIDLDGIYDLMDDVTFNSFGVFSNPVSGGLKKDLTVGLDVGSTTPSGLMFDPLASNGINNGDPGGPDWSVLRSWVNEQPDLGGELPVQASNPNRLGSFPVVKSFQLYWLPTYDAASLEMQMHLMPAIVLWNPYDHTLESTDYIVRFGRVFKYGSSFTRTSTWHTNFLLEFNSGAVEDLDPDDEIELSSEPNSYLLPHQFPLAFRIRGVSLQPGEAVVFSPPVGQQLYDLVELPDYSFCELVPGYNPGSTYYFPLNLKWKDSVDPADRKFKYYGRPNARTHALLLEESLGGGQTEPLFSSLYMNDAPIAQHILRWSKTQMYASPPGNQPLPTVETSASRGVKGLLVMVENTAIWPTTAHEPGRDPHLLPSSRRWLSYANPRAAFHGTNPLVYSQHPTDGGSDGGRFYSNAVSSNPTYVFSQQNGNDYQDVGVEAYDLDRNVNVGYSESQSSAERTVLFQSSPGISSIASIGQLSHAPLYHASISTDPIVDLEYSIRNARFGNLIPAYPIANSLADPSIPLDSLERGWSGIIVGRSSDAPMLGFTGIHHDYSYKLNKALWDDYFFSTLLNNGTVGNPLVVSVRADGTLPSPDFDQSANETLLDGAFNVNSTSVEAWKALIGAFYGEDIETIESGTVSYVQSDPSSALLRLDEPLLGPVLDNDGQRDVLSDDETYLGYRKLSASQIDALARRIVEEVKLRGPFPSISSFVNRMPFKDGTGNESVNAFRLRGTLASALDKAQSNESLQKQVGLESTNTNIPGFETEAEEGWRTENLTGWLSQGDILSRIGGSLSARSDTFRVRGYGEVLDPVTQEVIPHVRCEAIVQRLPEFVDDRNVPHTPIDSDEASAAGLSALTAINQEFGRRFVVLSFTWLEEGEI
ncbi:hypothetical protein [Puniceicoccus vermicola]|uniref:Verru_Chthon cassette protein A n=1 Tax=Puniceicoccus vermicola TaxID=388746 RepID=A0A7X1E2T0_9BACT|nr:hypothetical protein [Puniceicoccus vermicola]MBC2600336.1 hypothetical protein [Puniceicoccus vermicola]